MKEGYLVALPHSRYDDRAKSGYIDSIYTDGHLVKDYFPVGMKL